jgi:uncharacterized protein
MNPVHSQSGRVVAIGRYPIKSMMGEELNAIEVTDRGLLGDRAFALIDAETGKVASAKNPRRWPNLFDFRASYVEPPRNGQALPTARITLPDGESLTTDQDDVEARISSCIGRPVTLARSAPEQATAEGYWPDHDWLADRDQTFEVGLPSGTFFDCAVVHLVTTSTLDRLQSLAPGSRFETPRFRPNFVIAPVDGDATIDEYDWIGRTLSIGEVRLRIDLPSARCVMTTLSQGSLPKDPAILRTIVQKNAGNVGVYASVVSAGRVRRGDLVEAT